MRIWPLLGVALIAVAAAGAGEAPSGFPAEGLAPIHTGVQRADPLGTAASCRDCHPREYERWRASAHANGWDGPVFQAGFVREPVSRCVHCHAPRAEQQAEVVAVLPKGSFFGVREHLVKKGAVGLPASALAHDGIDCQGCHVRDGQVWTTRKLDVQGHVPHPEARQVGSAATCAACHQFHFHELRRGHLVLTALPMQDTYEEWRSWGGYSTCLECHAPRDPHDLKGTRDLAFLRGALEVTQDGRELVLKSRGVGHHFPTGDLFRHLTVEVLERGTWTQIARIGRRYEARPDAETGDLSMTLVEDTSLVPGVSRRIALSPHATRFRVRYHYVSEQSEADGDVAPEEAQVLLVEGDLHPNRAADTTHE